MIEERAELLKSLRAMPIVLRRLVRDVPDETLRRRPQPGEWAIIEVVAHLADTDERVLGRLRRVLAEDRPTLHPYNPAALAEERGYLRFGLADELNRVEALRAEAGRAARSAR